MFMKDVQTNSGQAKPVIANPFDKYGSGILLFSISHVTTSIELEAIFVVSEG